MGFWNKVLTFLGIKKKEVSVPSIVTGVPSVAAPIYTAPVISTPSTDSKPFFGIDIYHGDTVSDWNKLKASGCNFIFIKATQGTSYIDSQFHNNVARAKAAGILVGAYHFLEGDADGSDQANHFLSVISAGDNSLDLPCVMDLESMNNANSKTVQGNAMNFLATVHLKTQKIPIVYASPSFIDGLNNPPAFNQYYLWVAHYGVLAPKIPKPWTQYTFWQKSESASIAGVDGHTCDLNQFNGSLDKLKNLA